MTSAAYPGGKPWPRWPAASLRTYLIAVIIVATVPMGALTFVLVRQELLSSHQHIYGGLQRSASSLGQAVDRELMSSVDALTILSYADALQDEDFNSFHVTLARASKIRPTWSGIYLVDLQGRVVLSSERPHGAAAERWNGPWQPQRMAAQPAAMVYGLPPKAGSAPSGTSIQVPVRIGNKFRYVLVVSISPTAWRKLLLEANMPSGGFVTLFDNHHRIIARTAHHELYAGRRIPESNIRQMGSDASGLLKGELMEGGSSYAAWQRIAGVHWGVAIGVPAGPMDKAYSQAMTTALGACVVSLLAGIGMALVVARRVNDPLRRLAAGAAPGEIAVSEIRQLHQSMTLAGQQREQARRTLQVKADEFEALFNASPIGLAITQDTRCHRVLRNPALDAMFGETRGPISVLGRVFHQGQELPPSDQPLQRAARGEAVTDMTLEVRHPDGRLMTVLAHAVPLYDAKGQARGAIGAFIDLTERTLAEERLISAERRLRESRRLVELAQEAGGVGFLDLAVADDKLTVTPGLAGIFGVDAGRFGSRWADLIERVSPEDRDEVREGVRRAWQSHMEQFTLSFRVLPSEGTMRWLSIRVMVSYGGDGHPLRMIGVGVDVTDRQLAEQDRARFALQQQAARLEAEAANKTKDEFLAMLGHELRNPLGAISAAVEVLDRQQTHGEAAIKVRQIIARQTRHLARLMDDLLDVARVITGKILLSRQPVDLAVAARLIAGQLSAEAAAHGHALNMDVQEAWVQADRARLEQIISHLLVNAIRHTPSGTTVTLRVRRSGDVVRLDVIDDGPGIPQSLLPRIFDLFVQGERTLDRQQGGLGIGLTLVRRLSEQHGGTVEVESSAAGSIFTVSLPASSA